MTGLVHSDSVLSRHSRRLTPRTPHELPAAGIRITDAGGRFRAPTVLLRGREHGDRRREQQQHDVHGKHLLHTEANVYDDGQNKRRRTLACRPGRLLDFLSLGKRDHHVIQAFALCRPFRLDAESTTDSCTGFMHGMSAKGGAPVATHINDGLGRAQGFALQVEAQSIFSLLRDGHREIQSIRHISVSADSVFVLTSIGVAKAMKAIMSLCHLRDVGGWPSTATILGWGSDMGALNERFEATLSRNVVGAAHTEHLGRLLAAHRLDRYWPLLIDVLDHYGRSGQFYVLDHLAEADPAWEAPVESWSRLEYAVLSDYPGLVACLVSPLEADAGRRELGEYVARTLLDWWRLIHQFCIDGCFGERGTSIGQQLAPPDVMISEFEFDAR